MPRQLTFAQAEYAATKKVTRREQFLKETEQVLPWSALQALFKPHYYREEARGPGHPLIGLERVLRIYLLQQWYFGMNAHICVDLHSGLTHSLTGTAAIEAIEANVNQTAHLLHGGEKDVYADAGFIGADKREVLKDGEVTWRVAMKRGKLKAMDEGPLNEIATRGEHLKAKLRSLVVYPFHVVKNRFGHRKVRYRGLKTNTGQLYVQFALANLVIAKKALLA